MRLPRLDILLYILILTFPHRSQLHGNCCCNEENARPLTLSEILDRTFRDNLDIYQQYQDIENRLGLFKQESGRFDTNLQARISKEYLRNPIFLETVDPPLFYDDDKNKQGITEFEVFFEKRFRSGVFIRPSVFIQRIDDNFNVPTTQTTGQLKLTIEVPLMRNLGYENIGAGEIAAGLVYHGALYNFKHETARIIAAVTRTYWQYLYTKERLASFTKAFNQTKEFLEGLQKMIAAGEVAPTEAHQVITDLENRRANMERAEQDLFLAKQSLMLFMNVDPQEYNCLTVMDKKFPYPTQEELDRITCEVVDQWIQYAETQRADYVARSMLLEAATFLVNQAINNLQPELNVTVDVSTLGLRDGNGFRPYPESLSSHVRGTNLKGMITLNTPICQSFDRGVLQSRKSDMRRIQAQVMDLLNNMKADIQTRFSGVKRFAAQIAAFQIAVKQAEQAVIDEIRKFQMGISTVFDIIQLKDRLLNSEIGLIDAKFNYITSIIELRFFSGLIIPISEMTSHVDEDDIVSLPNIKLCTKGAKQHPFK